MHHSKRSLRPVLAFLLSLLLVGVSADSLQLHAQESPPPALVATEPDNGATWHGEPVVLRFDRAMAGESAEYLSVTPPIDGTSLVDGDRLVFTADTPPDPGQRYAFALSTKAAAEDGTRLTRPVEFSVVAAAPLQVTSTQPSDGASDINIETAIVVTFNRPVVPLTGLDAAAELPQPLLIEPAVEGKGEWINTSIYAFQPTLGLAGGVEYTVTVDDLTGLNGETLAEPVQFVFATTTPIVLDAEPVGDRVAPDAPIRVSFSQPMDEASTEAAFSLTSDGAPVAGTFSWSDDGKALHFMPDQSLSFGAAYEISVAATAQPASQQGTLREPYRSRFVVVPPPAVVSTSPLDGQSGVLTDRTVTIRFNAPLSYTTVLDNIDVSPVLTNTRVYSSYSDYTDEVTLNWTKSPDTLYTVTLGADIADPYGNTLGEPFVLTFTTGDDSAFTRINLPERFTHFSAASGPVVNAYYRNMDELSVDLYRLPLAELDRLTGADQWEAWQEYSVPNPAENLIWSRPYLPDVGRNVVGELYIDLNDADRQPLPPGIYFLEMNGPPGTVDANESPQRQQYVIVLTDYNLVFKRSQQGESLVWKTALASGEPAADHPIDLRADGEVIDSSRTDADGISTLSAILPQERSWVPVLAVSGQPGEADFALVSSDWNQGIGPWEYGLSSGYSPPGYQSHFYTDRPIYRSGQTVFWKGILRAYVDGAYELPPDDLTVQIVVRDDRGNEIYRGEHTVGESGTIHGQVPLAPEATSGFYYLEASLPGSPDGSFYGGVGFQVASYRAPEFEVSVTSDRTEYLQGETIEVEIEGSYFSGGPLANAPVDWRLTASPYSFFWQNAPDNRYFSFAPYDPGEIDFDPYRYNYFGGLVQEGSGTTDAEGKLQLELNADLSDSLTSQLWRVDATVQSSTNQFVYASTTMPVHVAEFVIGLSPRLSVVEVGQENTVDVVTLSALGAPDNPPYPGAELAVTVYEFIWNNVYAQTADGTYRWENEVQRTPVFSSTVTTGRDGMAEIVWTPQKGGQYQIEARGTDSAGNDVSSVTYVWAAGDNEPVAWRQENNDRIELVADKALYTPGEVARVLVPSPFGGPVQALITLERDGVLESSVMTLEGNNDVLEIPITDEHIPNIFASVVLIKGVDESDPIPAIRVGNVELPVDVSEKELTIAVEPSAELVRPGDVVSYTLAVRDFAGDPVADAEVSVAVVDKAILSLADGDDRSLIDIFYYRRGLGVTTSALLIINNDRLTQQLTEGAKGGGGGGGFGAIEVREEFADLAYWRADLVTDEAGEITFEVQLPDNLTTWVLSAKAINAATQVGDGTNEIIATKELQIRPLLPRFFTSGDRAKIGLALVNASDQSIEEGTLTLLLDGAEVEGGALERNFSLAPGEQARFDWTVRIPSDGQEVTFAAAAQATAADDSSLTDALRLTLPVNRYETPEVVGTSGMVPPDGLIETIIVPDDATDSGSLIVGLEASLAASMVDALDYLEHYPYECNEQTVSRFLPNSLTLNALRTLAIDDPAMAEQLTYQLGSGAQRLLSRQNPDGGWGYWPGEESSPFISTYVLWGLVHAQELGFPVAQTAIDAAVGYLDRSFVGPADVVDDWMLNEMAFTHFVLSEIGAGDPGRASTLYDVRERLALYGKAYLAMALDNMNADAQSGASGDPRVETLLDDLFGAIEYSATGASWHEETVDFQTLNTDIRTTAIVLAAFLRLDPEQPTLQQVVRWLMSARQAGSWSTTQENAWSIIALTDWLVASGELEADYNWQVRLNDTEMGSGRFEADNIDERVQLETAVADLLRDEANTLHFDRDSDLGQLYYTTHLRYTLDATAVDALDRGVVVGRRFEDEAGNRVNSATVGDVISVTTTIVIPAERYHLLVEVPIPAGAEVIDTALATEADYFGGPQMDVIGDSFGYWTPTYNDIRDDRVALVATTLAAGTYEYTFQMRATLPGEYRVLPVQAQQMYFPEVWGRSEGQLFTVKE